MKNNKKLSIVISSYDDIKNPVYGGGGAYSVHQLAKRLVQKYDVTVVTGSYKRDRNESIDNIKYMRIGSYVLGYKIGHLLYQYALLRYASKRNYDLWIESSTPPVTFSLLPLFSRKPVIIWINMLCAMDMRRKYKINLEFIERSLSKLYMHIIVPTDWVKKEIKAMNKEAKIFRVNQGINDITPLLPQLSFRAKPRNLTPQNYNNKFTGMRSLHSPPSGGSVGMTKCGNLNGNYLLYIGRIEVDQKGIDLLVQALPYTCEDVRVIIAGSGSKKEEDKLTNLIIRCGALKKVKRIGRVEGAEKEVLLKQAKAVIIPSRFETFSIAALESIVHKKPVICFDIPQLKWIQDKYSIKVKPFSVPMLAYSIDAVLESKVKKKITARDKEEFTNKYNWDNTAKKFEKVINTLLI